VLPTYARADITVVRGEGCRVWDDEGREYLDFVAGIAVVGLGHCAPAPLARPASSSTALARVEPLLDGADAPARAPAGRALSRRPGLLLQLRRRGERGGPQDRAQGDRPARGSWRSRGGFHGPHARALSATGQPSKWEGFGPLVPYLVRSSPNDVESLEAALAPAGDTALLLLEPVLGEEE
jgi:acetylornithine/succinyldiaminopimelate/putrescine aminotransferase